jgi:hypothetical protein
MLYEVNAHVSFVDCVIGDLMNNNISVCFPTHPFSHYCTNPVCHADVEQEFCCSLRCL